MGAEPDAKLVHKSWDADVDDAFGRAWVDIDEQRESPVAHRYVHGGFDSSDTRFSFYFPSPNAYEGRFFQHVTPVPQSENLAQRAEGEEDKLTFTLASGAYFVETNGGGPDAANPLSGVDPTIGAYRANAAAARFSRAVAAALYGEHRAYGYLYGGSGGGYRTIGAAENTTGVWDGYVPYVIGSPMAAPNVFAVRMHAQRVLRNSLDRIADAHDVDGDPGHLVLTDEEQDAFDEVTKMGFPPRSWFGWRTMGMHGFSALYPGIMAADPAYATDFWAVPGYLGADPDSSVHRDRVVHSATIDSVVDADAARDATSGGVDESFQHAGASSQSGASWVVLSEAPAGWILGAELHVRSGLAAGQVLRVMSVEGQRVLLEPGQSPEVVGSLRAGDGITLDNSNFLAAQTYHRHQVPGPEYPVYDMYRDGQGEPVHPQRAMLLGPMFAAAAAGSVPSGKVSDKMIVVSCMLDREAFPWQADWYRQRVNENAGGSADHRFRLWYIDNATHGDADAPPDQTHTVSYIGALHTALRQLAAWVERGIGPAASTNYTVNCGQVSVPGAVGERAGIQPVVSLSIDGMRSARVRVGQIVRADISADTPAGGLPLVSLALDLTGSGSFSAPIEIEPTRHLEMAQECTFDRPGTYFVSARVTSQSTTDSGTAAGRVHNIARARLTVED
ncbi:MULTISPECIES: hypothetical protein [unclassified Microbacterium]|uniref:hypothetical protein n=1 Tax=unclassified Microbacterium TaxID=2609290 RepID=UPI00214ABCB6|nr:MULTISPECIES: hypothetical protein [unclassified Microbacterium]MCR2783545.1 hypothetical protein [Microbacterium sp. zg.B96]WIM15594.1 hypothetical protein QNO11_13795 [Microbacterium sp. zg-B96]